MMHPELQVSTTRVPTHSVRALIIVAAGSMATAGTTPPAKAAESTVKAPLSWTGEAWTGSDRATEERSSKPTEGEQGSLVMELRRRTGLTWDQVGELFGVKRRSVHFWASGRPMNADHRDKLGRLLALIRRLPMDSEVVRDWLFSPDARQKLPFDLLRQGRFGEALPPSLPPVREVQRPRVAPEVEQARAPRPPEELVGALQDSVHREDVRFRAAIPLKKRT